MMSSSMGSGSDPIPTTTTTRLPSVTSSSPARPLPSHPQPRPLQFLQHHGLFPPQAQAQTYPRQQMGKAGDAIVYPLASSGRGLLPTPRGGLRSQFPHPSPSPSHSHSNYSTIRPPPPPPYLHPPHSHVPSASVPPVAPPAPGVAALPQPKVVSLPRSGPESNGQKELIDKGRDDNCVTVRDRKVKISEEASIYGLCRSWLRNGYPEETQPQYGEFMRSLPKPSPMPMCENLSPKRKESDDETEAEEGEKSVDDLSTKELLQRHIKQAKRVRARLREERLVRIERYKSRLALLLPPVLEQCRNDTTTGA